VLQLLLLPLLAHRKRAHVDAEISALLKKLDYDSYIASLLAPDAARPHLQALHVFNAEVARIRDSVSEPHIGLIRQQWWRDTLDAVAQGNDIDHPVAKALAKTLNTHALPMAALKSLIDAREFDLYADPLPSMQSLEGYLGETEASIIQLSCLILDPTKAKDATEAAGLAGVAFGISRHMANHTRLPQLVPVSETRDSLLKHGLKRWHEALSAPIPTSLFPAFISAAPTMARIHKLLQGKDLGPLRRQWMMWQACRRGRL
jgi:15-cis-phytoene synthase